MARSVQAATEATKGGGMRKVGTPRKDERQRDVRRRFEQWARNPKCEANTISAVHNVPMWKVAEREGLPRSMGQSPFAIQRGYTFERTLFTNGAATLVAELQRTGVLPAGPVQFEDCRLNLNGGHLHSLDDSRARTSASLRACADGTTTNPVLVAGATICIPGGVMLPEAMLVVDALVVRADEQPARLMVGEIKTYPDRAGYTDRHELAGARAQAGVYVHGLRVVIAEELELADRLVVAERGFLVLSRPGFSRPSARADEDLRYQAERARRGFLDLNEAADQFDPPLCETTEVDQVAAVSEAVVDYHELCWTFCDRAPRCHRQALEAGNAVVLGDEVARFLGDVSLTRAMALMKGATPANAAEIDVARRIAARRRNGAAR
jgi:hypothetical protein